MNNYFINKNFYNEIFEIIKNHNLIKYFLNLLIAF